MIKVLRHGNTIAVTNPITGKEQEMVNVVFVEEGRSGGDTHMSESSRILSELIGEEVGLGNLRIHTQPVLSNKIGLFPVEKEFPGHINRGLFSTPQMRQQEEVDPTMIDGRPTYFKTWIGTRPEDDVDERISTDVLISSNPSSVFNATVRRAQVRVIENRGPSGRNSEEQADVGAGTKRAQPAQAQPQS